MRPFNIGRVSVALLVILITVRAVGDTPVYQPLTLHERNESPQTRYYTFELTRKSLNPDGVTRDFLVVNGQYPGPTIQAILGDTLSVTVINNIENPKEGTSVHWHGLAQKDSKWADGVPSVTQCPIAYGHNFTYVFKADTAGTTWWHAHFTAQYTDGIFGALIIHGSKYGETYDIDVGPVHLHDTYHVNYVSYLLPVYKIPAVFIPVDNNLISGRAPFDCALDTHGSNCTTNSTGYTRFHFKQEKKHLLRLINDGGVVIQHFSIDDHELMVVAIDFVPVKPYKTDVVTLGVGQRTDVIVTGKENNGGAFWMRSEADVFCVNGTVWQPNATAVVWYDGWNQTKLPTSTGHFWKVNNCLNDDLDITQPLEARSVPTPDLVRDVQIAGGPNGTGNLVFSVDGSQFRANFTETPLLLAASAGITAFADHPEYNIHVYDATHVRLVLYNSFPVTHTMHLHGHNDFQILAEGVGTWDGAIVQAANPVRRDSAQMRMGFPGRPSYVVIQYEADNPGAWSLHCHVVIHVSAGLYMTIFEHPDQIEAGVYEEKLNETCVPWKKFVEENEVPQFDSGLRKVLERNLDIIKKYV